MESKLKSSTKVSETSYKHCTEFPIHRTGQGSSNSPTIWCFISCVLFQCHNQRASGKLFTSPAGDTVVRFNMAGFVDDSTCITGCNPNDTMQQLLEKMQAENLTLYMVITSITTQVLTSMAVLEVWQI
jgi:Zn-finger protein